jgi:hypothetical protein
MTESWLPALVGSSQHALQVILALSDAQAGRPRSASRIAASVAGRPARTGLEVVVIADAIPVDELLAPPHAPAVISASGPSWIAEDAPSTDLVIVPGVRNGLLGPARVTRSATSVC